MRSPFAGFFSKQILGVKLFKDYFFEALKAEIADMFGMAIGEAVLDPTGTGTGLGLSASADAIGERTFDITGDKWCLSNSGNLLNVGTSSVQRSYTSGSYGFTTHDDAWFDSVPHNNTNGVVSYVYIGKATFPVDIHIASDGSRGYGIWADGAGFVVTPNTITVDGDGKITVLLDSSITALGIEHWSTAVSSTTRSMAACVWLDTTQTGVSIRSDNPQIAIAVGRLVKNLSTGAWKIDLTAVGDGKLGQGTASLTAAHYKVAILGPVVTEDDTLMSSDEYVFIGTVSSITGGDTVDVTGQAVTTPYATYAAGFSVEHVADSSDPDLGRHKQVTAIGDGDLLLRVDSSIDQEVRITNMGSGLAIFVVEDYMQVPKIEQAADLMVDLKDSVTDRNIWFQNSGTQTLTMYVDGTLECTNTTGGSGIIRAKAGYEVSGSQLYTTVYDALTIIAYGFHHATGTGTLVYNNGGGSINYVFAGSSITAVKTVLVPIHPPHRYTLKEIRVNYLQSAGGTPDLRVAIGRWDEGVGTITNVTGWQACTIKTGAWATETFNLGAGYQLLMNGTQVHHLMIEITNNGIAVDTSRIGRVELRGTLVDMPTFQS